MDSNASLSATSHDDRIERLMQTHSCTVDAAERLAWEADQVARLRERLNDEQRHEIRNENGTKVMVQVAGLTDEQIDAEAEVLQRRLREGR